MLTTKYLQHQLLIVDKLTLKETNSKLVEKLIDSLIMKQLNMKLGSIIPKRISRNVFLCYGNEEPESNLIKSCQDDVPGVLVSNVDQLRVLDMMKSDWLIVDQLAIEKLESWLK